MQTEKVTNLKWYEKLSYFIVTKTEEFYYRLGFKVASHPWRTILYCLMAVVIGAFGFLRFHHEKNPMKLWVPPHSDFIVNTDWLVDKYQIGTRNEIVIVKSTNVLTPEIMNEVFKMNEEINNIITEDGIRWKDVCFRIPEIDPGMEYFMSKGKKRINSTDEADFDPSAFLSPSDYCKIVGNLEEICFHKSITSLWQNKARRIQRLTQEDILTAINNNDKFFVGPEKSYQDLLGNVVRNSTGHVVAAGSVASMWMVNVNFSAVDMDKSGNIAGTADWASLESLEWEEAFLNKLNNLTKRYLTTEKLEVFYAASRSFGDISAKTMFQEMDILIIGIFIMCNYVQFVISKMNWIEARLILGNLGLLSVGMAFVLGCGLCALMGISYGPVHTSLPFLLMGLGVDDMFVITTCWDQIPANKRMLPLPERIGLMLKHAGVSITVTSITDVMAFLIGATTILPCLQSFCLYTAVGVLITFIFVVTFFIACFTLDQRRVEQNRNGALPCIIHNKVSKDHFSQKQYTSRIFEYVYSKIILTIPGKIIVISITIICAGLSIESSLRLEQKFDPNWFIPQDTYLGSFFKERTSNYPSMGFDAGFYTGEIDYPKEVSKIQAVVEKLENLTHITNNINSWVKPFQKYTLKKFRKDILKDNITNEEWNTYLSKFLYSPVGGRFQGNFIFNKKLECGTPTGNITVSQIDYRFNHFEGPDTWIPAMYAVKDIAQNANFTTGDRLAISWAKIFGNWETDVVIDKEVLRNMQLALVCVMGCTLLLIANIQICFWIFLCVLLTMINVCGFMQRWGLTVDLVTSIGLQLAIGLCVDYATHIGHTFLTIQEGSLKQRAIRTVSTIGSAVLFGGLSTLIGVSALSHSVSYTFQAFFKIFLLVVLFGLFHGVVLLPVILSLIGPLPYRTHQPVEQHDLEQERGNLSEQDVPLKQIGKLGGESEN